jgi:hypothetical protein
MGDDIWGKCLGLTFGGYGAGIHKNGGLISYNGPKEVVLERSVI